MCCSSIRLLSNRHSFCRSVNFHGQIIFWRRNSLKRSEQRKNLRVAFYPLFRRNAKNERKKQTIWNCNRLCFEHHVGLFLIAINTFSVVVLVRPSEKLVRHRRFSWLISHCRLQSLVISVFVLFSIFSFLFFHDVVKVFVSLTIFKSLTTIFLLQLTSGFKWKAENPIKWWLPRRRLFSTTWKIKIKFLRNFSSCYAPKSIAICRNVCSIDWRQFDFKRR